MEVVLRYKFPENILCLKQATLQHLTASYLSTMGSYDLALEGAQRCLNVRRQYSSEQPTKSLLQIMSLLCYKAQYTEAEKLARQIIESNNILGLENMATQTIELSLAAILYDIGQGDEAKEICRRVLNRKLHRPG